MRTFIIFISVWFLIPALLAGKSYFIKLTPAGLAQRSQLLRPNALPKAGQTQIRAIVPDSRQPSFLQSWLQIEIRTEQDKSYLQTLREQGLVAETEDVGYFKLQSISHDSLVDEQWYLPLIGMSQAWHISQGDSSVIVAIIDTGVDYLHPDLAANIWHNQAELHGQPGVDDDQNGYVDDVLGWDFTDAPRFPDGGDYLQPDPDPMDEFSGGHGTEVAGIIAAVRNNGIGISGIAPRVKIMVLRAGTASGYLEEDDVIRALIYAWDNGAKIVNMSFGDKQVSALFHDVLRFLSSQGMILVAAAGNDGSPEVYYPAGFEETIAVGASNQNDWLAGFSNYGSLLDLIAPGVDILSTAPGNAYLTVNGTSFSAPMVSAAAALLVAQHPQFTPEEVRTVLKGSAKDLAEAGFDSKTGAGRLNVWSALQIKKSGTLQMLKPTAQASIGREPFPVVITAQHPDLQQVRLDFGLGQNPDHWQNLASSSYRFYFADTMAFLPLKNFPDTTLTLRLSMRLVNGRSIELMRSVCIDRTPPVLLEFKQVPAYEGSERLLLFSVKTDDPTSLHVTLATSENDSLQTLIDQPALSTSHFFTLSPQSAPEGAHLVLRMSNGAGFEAEKTINVHFPPQVTLEAWQDFGALLPAGYLLPKVTDLNNDGQKELVLSQFASGGTFGPVYVYEFERGRFVERWHSGQTFIPRDAGDVNGNGKNELLLSFGSYSCLMEANTKTGFPAQVIWQDSSFWAAALCDLDGDGNGEIVGYRDSLYQILEWDGAGHFRTIANLPNPTAGTNRLGVPFVSIGDFNRDGRQDVAFGDYDGDVIVYTCTGDDRFELLASGHGDQGDATDLFSMNPGALYLLTHTPESENLESQWEKRYWSLNVLRPRANSRTMVASLISGFYPFYPKKNFGSSLQYLEEGGKHYLFVGAYPYLYVLRKTNTHWQPVWVQSSFNSNTVLFYDFNGDGHSECYFNNGKAIVGYARQTINRPFSPVNLRARAQDSLRIRLSWEGSATNGFLVYRCSTSGAWHVLAHTRRAVFIDSLLPQMGHYYYYRVTALDSLADYSESLPSNVDSARTGYPPRLLKAWQESATQIILEFDRSMEIDPQLSPRVFLQSSGLTARSVVVISPDKRLLATFSESITSGKQELLTVQNVFSSGIPVDKRFNSLPIICDKSEVRPFVKEIHIDDRRHIRLTFNVPMDAESVSDLSHYRLTPSGQVEHVKLLNADNSQVLLTLSPRSMAGGFGQSAYLIVNDLKSKDQLTMALGQEISLIRPVDNLQQLVVYPQPVRPENRQLIFAKLPQNTEIQIFTLNGKRIRTFHDVNQAGGVVWDLRDDSGKKVESGVYFYRVECHGEQRVGKLVIVR